jgi:hypothetical protein
MVAPGGAAVLIAPRFARRGPDQIFLTADLFIFD